MVSSISSLVCEVPWSPVDRLSYFIPPWLLWILRYWSFRFSLQIDFADASAIPPRYVASSLHCHPNDHHRTHPLDRSINHDRFSFGCGFLQYHYAVSMSIICQADIIRDSIRWSKISLLVLASTRRHRCSIPNVFVFAQMKLFLLLFRGWQ